MYACAREHIAKSTPGISNVTDVQSFFESGRVFNDVLASTFVNKASKENRHPKKRYDLKTGVDELL